MREPAILGLISFFMYIASLGVVLVLAVQGGCGWRGSCHAPIAPFLPVLVSHWVIIGLVMNKSVRAARILLLVFGALPFIALSLLKGEIGPRYQEYVPVVYWYLFIFGVVFSVYLFTSKEVMKYIAHQKNMH